MDNPIFDVSIHCPREDCCHKWSENAKPLVVDAEGHEKEMGTETRHIIEGQATCPKCHRIFSISGDIWEYPQGVQEAVDLHFAP